MVVATCKSSHILQPIQDHLQHKWCVSFHAAILDHILFQHYCIRTLIRKVTEKMVGIWESQKLHYEPQKNELQPRNYAQCTSNQQYNFNSGPIMFTALYKSEKPQTHTPHPRMYTHTHACTHTHTTPTHAHTHARVHTHTPHPRMHTHTRV